MKELHYAIFMLGVWELIRLFFKGVVKILHLISHPKFIKLPGDYR